MPNLSLTALSTGDNGLVAHECILDLRPLKETSGISVDDVAKRLDAGGHIVPPALHAQLSLNQQ